jgi:hypothetical protein
VELAPENAIATIYASWLESPSNGLSLLGGRGAVISDNQVDVSTGERKLFSRFHVAAAVETKFNLEVLPML